MSASSDNLKVIWFEGEMLPNWAQLLDVAARLSPVSEDIRGWFARLADSAGVDDARTIVANAETLQHALRENREAICSQLQRTRGDVQANQIFAAWQYALGTMIQEAASKKTCSWKIEGVEDTGGGDFGDGDITLRRV